jgi:hypothetical protein
MPEIDWTPEHKRTTTVEFDRLKLKVGERARIVCLDKPTFTWVHTLRAPKIVDGRANKVIKKRKDGSEFADWDMDFIGRPQCLGDHGVIADEGLDAKNCPICARAKDSEETSAPERRFAMNIIKYNTKSDGNIVTPFGCASQVWTFTEGIFNKLYDIANEYGGLVGRDLILGPCQAPEAFQKFDISVGAKNVWEADDKIKAIVLETHEHNKVDNLEAACGRRAEARWLKEDVKKIADRWRIAHGNAPAADSTAASEVSTLKGELDNLLAAPATTTRLPAEQPSPVAPDPTTTLPQTSNTMSTGPDEPDDFSKLLEGLKI